MKTTYSTRYIHKISPKDSDVGPDVTVSAALLGSLTRNEAQLRLAKTLRAQGALGSVRSVGIPRRQDLSPERNHRHQSSGEEVVDGQVHFC